jgi:hypothetical protein
MVKDDLIHHSSYGKYSATLRAVKEMQVDEETARAEHAMQTEFVPDDDEVF